MIDLSNIAHKNPEVVLRGEYGLAVGDGLIIAPNAKNGKILILLDTSKQIAAIAHFDNADKLEQNMNNIFNEMRLLGSDIKDVSCSVMEKESGHSFTEKLHKTFKEKVEKELKENSNHKEVNHTSWSGNDFCNVVLKGSGDILIDNSPELMRAALNLLIFSIKGDERLNNAMNPALVSELQKIKGSASEQQALENMQLLKQTPSTIFVKLGSEALSTEKSQHNALRR